jgi:Lrp/AsnC family transcriptional regulator, leucine-responsive regulatory protein
MVWRESCCPAVTTSGVCETLVFSRLPMGYTALLNQKALGLPDTVMVEVTINQHDDATLETFGRGVVTLPEAIEAYPITGEFDYFIKVAVSGTEG